MNPLKFIQNNSPEPGSELSAKNVIVLSNKSDASKDSSNKAQTPPQPSPSNSDVSSSGSKSSQKRPMSMAEALQAYTGKVYGNPRKKQKIAVVDSEEDIGEEVGEEVHLESESVPEPGPDQESSSDVFESANEYQDASESSPETPDGEVENSEGLSDKSDSEYVVKSEKSESESQSISEEPEDLNALKQDLKDEAATSETVEPDTTEKTSQIDISKYYGFNELPKDKGSNGSTRINKSFGKDYKNKKPIGLINQGVTCYMNTAIQSMVHIPAISNYLKDIHAGKYDKILPPKSVSHVLAELSHRLWNLENNKKKYIHPKRMINRLEDINCMMSEWQQEDSHEYFMSLMLRLQEDSTPKGVKLNKSIIYDIFGGLLNQTVICESCENKSETKQEFYDLSLGFRKKKQQKYSIERSIKDFFSKELLKTQDKESGYFCEKCKKNTNATKFSTIDTAPEYLTVHLKRFKFNGSQSMKVKQLINYSDLIDLTEFTTDKNPTIYKLISIISHEGRNLSSGHYISHCLQPDNSWYTYDDEYLNKINEMQALNDPSAYVLIYTKLTSK